MKNKYYEYLRQKRKEFIKSNKCNEKQYNKDGLVVYHIYDYESKLSWWDDVGFKMGKKYYVVFWIHPRMKYADMVEDIAHNNVSHLYNQSSGDIFDNPTKNFKKVGKSRKKVISYTSNPNKELSSGNWYDSYMKAREDILNNGGVIAEPSFKVTPLSYAKAINICYPMEIHNEEDLNVLVGVVKKLIKGEISISELVGNYQYTRDNWKLENIVIEAV